jgi:hypothetical protein
MMTGSMPSELIIYRDRRFIRSRYVGEVTLADVLGQRSAMIASPDFDPEFTLIVDLSEATRIAMRSAEIRKIAQTPSPVCRAAMHILVAPRADLFGMARMYQILGENNHPNTIVVTTLAEAIKFIEGK